MADLRFCSHYPFSSQARQYVKERGMELSSSLIGKAEDRLGKALSSGKMPKVAPLQDAMEEELALYAAGRMMLSAAANRYLINRYAVAEAKRASDYLSGEDGSKPEYLQEIASEFGLSFSPSGSRFSVPLAEYLKYTPRSVDYKLSNREVSGGRVLVSRYERIRIVEEAVRKRMERELPIRAEFPSEIKEAGEKLLLLLPRLEPAVSKVGQENYPPCIKKLLEELSMNANLAHTARVSLGIYLIGAGMKDDEIMGLFRSAPDFSERTTGYQVDYLRKKKYSMPSCATMDSYGICVAECRCGTPLRFRAAIHGRNLREEEKQ